MAAVITFATTYALILPAITVEREHTDEVAGMYLEQGEDGDDVLVENAYDPTGVNMTSDMDNAEISEDADVETDAEIPEYDELAEEIAPGTPAIADGEELTAALPVKTLEASGSGYTVTLSYDESSGIPEEAYLTASEIAPE